jgi:acrylyl-CoA reductase (NADPH)
MDTTFNALLLNQVDEKTQANVKTINQSDLPEGEVLVKVNYSGINYKDALAVTGTGKIVNQFPFVTGIDFVGEVITSSDENWQTGDQVILTGWGVGERHWGGYAEYAQVKAKWLVPLPAELISAQQSMIIGTAGFTAGLCVQEILDAGVKPEDGDIIISGASGGVGSFAVALLANMGYSVYAISRSSSQDYLTQLGAKKIISREDGSADSRPLEKSRWAAGIDTVGNKVLSRMLAEMNYGGVIAACGLAGGFKLSTTVMPFILRGVSLRGIDSVMYPTKQRAAIWQLIGKNITEAQYKLIHHSNISLTEIANTCTQILQGEIQGRVTVKL